MPLDNLMSLDDFPVPHIQDPQTKSCSCCGDPLDFLTTVEIFNSSSLPVLFGKVWVLECGHLVDSQCAFLLLTHTAMRMFLPRQGGGQVAAMAHAVAKIWACPVSSCPAIYRSVLSRRTRGWTIAPGHSGQVEAMKPAYSHTLDGRPLSGLAELEELILKFGSLLQSLERWRGRNSRTLCLEFMTDWSKRHVPPIAIAISATVANLSGADGNAYVLDAITAQTIASRPHIPREWLTDVGIVGPMLRPSHLYGEHLVLVSPGFLTVGEYERYGSLDWLIPKGQSTGSSVGGQSEAVAKSKAVLEEQKRRETKVTESVLQMLRDFKME